MTPPPLYTLFGTSIAGVLTLALMQPTNAPFCAGGLLERTDILGNAEKCVNVLGSDLGGLVGAFDPLLAAGVVGALAFVIGLVVQHRKSA
jgi:hypothetical protein